MPKTPDKIKAHFLELLRNMCSRPTMYMGHNHSLSHVLTYLAGYSRGFHNGQGKWGGIGGWDLLDYFDYWLQIKFAVKHPAWSRERILMHFHDHDEKKALRAISDLFKEYSDAEPENGYDYEPLKEQLQAAIVKNYGTAAGVMLNQQGAPICAVCRHE